MQKQQISKLLNNNELKVLIKQNCYLIYEYINKIVLHDLAVISIEYYIELLKKLLLNPNLNLNQNLLPYYLFTLVNKNSKLDFTSLRVETIDLNKLNQKIQTYYNYVKFSLNKEFFIIELKQNKIGGMPIEEDLIKYKKEIPLNKIVLEEFILNNKTLVKMSETKKNKRVFN